MNSIFLIKIQMPGTIHSGRKKSILYEKKKGSVPKIRYSINAVGTDSFFIIPVTNSAVTSRSHHG